MIEKGKLIFKFWFKNGAYIEKEVAFDENMPQEEIESFGENLPKSIAEVRKTFKENVNGEFHINILTVRCSELIAFDIIPIVEERQNADL